LQIKALIMVYAYLAMARVPKAQAPATPYQHKNVIEKA